MSFIGSITPCLTLSFTLAVNYNLQDTYQGNNFFNQFNFDTVHYGQFGKLQTYNESLSLGMINWTDSTVYIGTDYTNKVNSSGRPSIQLSSKNTYNYGLFILDASHMPQGCGTWPAWWLLGPDWPNNGEIDIIENVDLQNYDQSTLHTSLGCDFNKMPNKTNINETGTMVSYNCTQGCSVVLNNQPNTFGIDFNNNGGGIYACEVNNKTGIHLWFWDHENVPNSIINGDSNIDTNTFGIPYANWPFGDWCPSIHFRQLSIIFDLYYCGWAGDSYIWEPQCSKIANNQSCEDFVMNNPSYFKDAYWLINYVKVFQ